MLNLRYASVCSGIEAPSAAWGPLGWEPIFFSEIEPFPSAVLQHHYPDVPNLGDMTKIDGSKYAGKVDVLIGGTPCQSFSVAGKRRSLDDERGNLTLKFVELCDAIKPAFAIWENVPGVLSTRDNAFGCFLGALSGHRETVFPGPVPQMGKSSKFWRWDRKTRRHIPKWPHSGWVAGPKRTIAWRVLDAQFFGLAQRRKRVFVMASPRNGADPREILFECGCMRRDTPPSRKTREDVAGTISRCSFTGGAGGRPEGAAQNHFVVSQYGEVAGTISARHDLSACADRGQNIVSHWEGGPHPSLSQSHNTGGIGASNQELFSQGGAGLVQTFDRQSSSEYGTSPVASMVNARDYKGASDLIAFTQNDAASLRSGSGGGVVNQCISTSKIRRLTPVECERLQGFEDNYTRIPWNGKPVEECPDGHRYQSLGNSMAVPAIHRLGEWIENFIATSQNPTEAMVGGCDG